MTSNSDFTHLTTGGQPAVSIKEVKPPPIDFHKTTKDAYVSQLDQLTKKIQSEQQSQATALKLNELALATRVADAFESSLERALREAQELMAASRYREATFPLARALQEAPGHPEATYLLAYCCANLNELEQALLLLLPLRQVRLEPELGERVQALKVRIRNNLLLMVMLENVILIQSRKYDIAISRLTRLTQLDPDAEMYHFLLGGSLMMAERLEQALKAVQVGIQNCAPTEAELLPSLKTQIMERYAAKQLEPARDLVKKGQPAKARDRILKMPPDLRGTEICSQFERYLGRMQRTAGLTLGGQDKTRLPAPASNYQEMETLHFFLVGNEVREAGQLMQQSKFQDAEKVLARVVTWTPQFPYSGYLYASCIVARLFQQLESRKKPSQDEVHASLELAHNHARAGAVDSEIQDAEMLVRMIEQTLAAESDAQLIGSLMQEFQAIMTGAKKGIRSPEQLNNVYQQMSLLRERVNKARPQVHSSQATQELNELAEAVERNYKQLEDLRAGAREAEIVNQYGHRFMERMEGIKKRGGLKPWERDSERTFFTALRSEAQQAKMGIRNTEGQKQMSNLLEAIDNVLRQIG
jgi:tetratricopeptide (TPR) repeat protein